jgi:hypothetical protein
MELSLFAIFVCLMFLNCPVAFAMLLSPSPFPDPDIPCSSFRSGFAGLSFPLLAMPFFILAARIMNSAGITRRLFNFCLVRWGISGGSARQRRPA